MPLLMQRLRTYCPESFLISNCHVVYILTDCKLLLNPLIQGFQIQIYKVNILANVHVH